MKTSQSKLSILGLAMAFALASRLVQAHGTETPRSFRQLVEAANAVVVGRVEAPESSLLMVAETGVEVEEVIKGEIHVSEIFLDGPGITLPPDTRLLLFLHSPRVQATEIVSGWTQSRTIYSLMDTEAANLDDPANAPLLDAARRYADVAEITDPEQKAQALASHSIVSLGTNHPVLVFGAALDLQTIPNVSNYLSDGDHEAIANAVLRTDNGNFYKRDLLDAVGAARSLASVNAVIFSLTQKNSANIRENAGRNLAYLNAPGSEELLIRNLTDPRKHDVETQASLAHALGAMKSKTAVPLLVIRATNGNGRDARMEAILALGKIQDERALIALQQALSDPDPVIQRATLQALAWLDKPEAYDLLRSFEASSTDPRMKLLAQMLLKVPKRTIPIYMD